MKLIARSLVATAVAMLFAGSPMPARADLAGEMQNLFGSMSNSTPPGYWDTQRAGILAGGSLTERNQVYNRNILSIVPPSFNAGCGGIDLFGGSFSFINADQFVQLLRGVASNAAGYAFHLALTNMCPDCAQVIETMQKKIQQLNQYFGNSCQLGQGLVNDTMGSFFEKGKSNASILGTLDGAGDVFSSWTNTSGSNPYEQAKAASPTDFKKKITGNLIWRAMKTNGTSSWFTYGDDTLLQAIMNITGTVVTGDLTKATDGSDSQPIQNSLPGNQITVQDLMTGGTAGADGTSGSINIFTCNDGDMSADGCLTFSAAPTPVPFTGFQAIVQQKLDTAINDLEAGTLTAADQAILSPGLPGAPLFGTMIFQLSKNRAQGFDLARELAAEAAPHYAFEMAMIEMNEMIKAAQESSALIDHTYVKKLQDQLKDARHNVEAEYQNLWGKIGKPGDIYEHYARLLSVMGKARYAVTGSGVRN